MKAIRKFAVLLKRLGIIFITIIVILIVWDLYVSFFSNLWYGRHIAISIGLFWLLSAYFVLPRIHRFLSKIYLPPYFVGRTRTADGLLGDPVNLAMNGSKKVLLRAMKQAGWQEADKRTFRTSFRIVYSSLLHRNYPNAPVSDLYVFGRRQDLSFQMEVGGNPSKRHHVRFWRVPAGWYLPGGYKVDWVGASTYDDAVGFSLFTMQVTHSIDAHVDKERDFLVQTLQKALTVKSSTRIKHYFNGYQTRNGGGHHYITDGSFVIVDLLGESESRSDSSIEHANLDSVQQEVYNLALAKAVSVTKKDAPQLIDRIQQELDELKEIAKTNKAAQKIANEAVDVLVQTVQFISALGLNTSEVYRDKMDHNWQTNVSEKVKDL